MLVKNVEKEKGSAKVTVEIAKDEFENALTKAYAKVRKNIALPGFRKGKAPRKMVEAMYGATVFFEDAVNEIFPEIYQKAVTEQQIKAVGSPSVANMDTNEEGNVELVLSTELYPEVTLGEYKGIEVPKADAVVTEEEVNAEIEKLVERNSRIETVEREAQMGDTVVLDYEGFDNGVAFAGGSAKDHSLTLGSHAFVPGFEEALVGVKAGDVKDIDVTFPENYTPELAGKPVVFHCEIHEVKQTIRPELDDEFAKDVSEFDTLDELKKDLEAGLLKSKQEEAERAFENAAVELAAQNMTCDIPACMIDEQVDKDVENFSYQIERQGIKVADYLKMIGGTMDSLRASVRPMAETTVRSNVLLSEIVDKENIEVLEEEVSEELNKLAEQYKMEVEKIKEAVEMEALKADLKVRKAVRLIVANAKPVEVSAKKAEEGEKE